jgi:hypothetical protein
MQPSVPGSKRSSILVEVCSMLQAGMREEAAVTLRSRYPFSPLTATSRRYTPTQCMRVFVRDGFIDRYSGRRLVFPGTLRLLTKLLPIEFPFQSNWKTDACHFAFYELFPTIDHRIPVSRGGADDEANWVTTSMLLNSAKANFTLEDLGWKLHAPGEYKEWDGLVSWFLTWIDKDPSLLSDAYFRRWHAAAVSSAVADREAGAMRRA